MTHVYLGHLRSIEITIPYHLYHNLLNIIGQQPARSVAPIWQTLSQAREDATTDDIVVRLFHETVYRITAMLAIAPANEAADLYLIFSAALDRHNAAVAAEQAEQRREQWEREAPMRKFLDALTD